MTKTPSLLDLLKSGVHFGHQTSRWHPKMEQYIFGERNGAHIIDLEKTISKLEEACNFIQQIVANGGKVLFLGTKNQVQDVLEREAKRCEAPYITQRWIGGFLTNFSIVIKLAKKYKELVRKRDSGELAKYTKKEQLNFEKEIAKLERSIFGVKDMEKLPNAIFVWDVKNEKTAIKEAQVKKIPVVGICDTNTNPDGIDYVIPSNDDATKAIDLLITYIADCVIDAQKGIKKTEEKKNNHRKRKKEK